ncbi:50S ribosomal protein L1 [miscellaneous Crenarchaeota group-15 archaeon DG-45]|jgi:large subunit ribosomal protein L1|uniref:Large ribosomal subunit protein uL1 n=1 Tax=miscellaneous Crenarchaeota group-15 archaeon DG-45 TaxID=1685127 RepID=A0A0M0BKV4_9ARCH|nr:MAG: 50S ribosomal protein L1 [miscellaneous Crenarchaeota group-15 archaeon DG-45]
MSIPREKIIDALAKAREAAPERGFEQSIDLTVNLRELDMRRPENRVNLRIHLPNGVGSKKVLVFASGDLALRARRAGADSIIEPPELQEMASDKKAAKKRLKDFDVFIAEAPLMPTVGRVVGPILGPKGKMPTPVPPQAPIDTVIERERRAIILRSRDKPILHCIVGSEGMEDEKVAENVENVLSSLFAALRRGIGNIRSIYLKLTMGPAVKVL